MASNINYLQPPIHPDLDCLLRPVCRRLSRFAQHQCAVELLISQAKQGMRLLSLLKAGITQLDPDMPCINRFIGCCMIGIAIDISPKSHDRTSPSMPKRLQ